MEYLIEIKYVDVNYNANIHFLTTFNAVDENDALLFYNETISAFSRNKVKIQYANYERIDNDPEKKAQFLLRHNQFLQKVNDHVEIEQFFIKDPDQNMSLWENLLKQYKDGDKNANAYEGRKHQIPVNVIDRATFKPTYDVYYFSVQHLIPKR